MEVSKGGGVGDIEDTLNSTEAEINGLEHPALGPCKRRPGLAVGLGEESPPASAPSPEEEMAETSEECESSSTYNDSPDRDRMRTGLSTIYCIRRSSDMYKDIETVGIEDMALERNKRSHPNPNFLYTEGRKYNYSILLDDLCMRQGTRKLRKDVKVKLLIERFFSELDKFVWIANYCLKNVEVGDGDRDFNFALSWIRRAFHWLGIDGAKYYANKSPGPYNGWNRDISFLMNRYFFSPEFNHVNGFGIEESIYGGCQFVENGKGELSLVYAPYPGYYDTGSRKKQFCSVCDIALPSHLSIPRNGRHDK